MWNKFKNKFDYITIKDIVSENVTTEEVNTQMTNLRKGTFSL